MNMPQPVSPITKDLETLLQDKEKESDFQQVAGNMEAFYISMRQLGIAREEDYNVVGTGMSNRLPTTFMVGEAPLALPR
jgi:hypothetical protein